MSGKGKAQKKKQQKRNFLVFTMSLAGHINQMFPIVQELVKRGHSVGWYTGRNFQERVEASGAHYCLPASVNSAVTAKDGTFDFESYVLKTKNLNGINNLKFSVKIFLDLLPQQIDDTKAILREFPADVMLSDIAFFGPSYFAEKKGIPWAVLGVIPLHLPSRDTAPFGLGMHPNSSKLGRLRNRFMNWLANDLIFSDINALAKKKMLEVGLSPLKKPLFDADSVKRFSVYLQPTTQAFEYQRSDMPPNVHFIGPLFPSPPKDFSPPSWWDDLKSGRPVVLVSQGTIATDYESLLIPTIKALADEDVLVIATTGGRPVDKVNINQLPSNTRLERFAPYFELMPHVDVMVTNGGYGGAQFALSRGVPLVVAGRSEEKAEVAARVAWSGVGIDLKTNSPKLHQIRDAVKKILSDPGYKEKARQIKADFAKYNAPVKAADMLEELAATKKPILRER
jgi:MGT family glycosyltransferase